MCYSVSHPIYDDWAELGMDRFSAVNPLRMTGTALSLSILGSCDTIDGDVSMDC
jgi:hypothetical protein